MKNIWPCFVLIPTWIITHTEVMISKDKNISVHVLVTGSIQNIIVHPLSDHSTSTRSTQMCKIALTS